MKKILVFGEVLWDLLPSGKQIGGAPGNFAFHARTLGADARMVSRVGDDELGREVFSVFRKRAVPTEFIGVDSERPTGRVEVTLRDGQPSYRIVEDVAWDRIEPNAAALEFVRSADAVCFGSLACRSESNRAHLRELLAAAPKKALVIFDLNLRKPFYSAERIAEFFPLCDAFKLNDEELIEFSEMVGQPLAPKPFFSEEEGEKRTTLAADKGAFIKRLFAESKMSYLILTCGSKGSFLFARDGEVSFSPAVPTTVVNTVGAGDAFTAVCATGILTGRSLAETGTVANRYAAFVCSQSGGMPDGGEKWGWAAQEAADKNG